MPLLVTADI